MMMAKLSSVYRVRVGVVVIIKHNVLWEGGVYSAGRCGSDKKAYCTWGGGWGDGSTFKACLPEVV